MSKQLQKCPNFIRTKDRHLDNLMNWIVRMGNTGDQSDDPGNDSGDDLGDDPGDDLGDNSMNWIVTMGNTGFRGYDPGNDQGKCKRKKKQLKNSCIFFKY